jgi:predicted GNAT superfamily acetyltransferase
MAGIDIRPVDTLSDIRQIETIQLETWGMDDLEVIPARFMHALQHNGASLLGAYDGERMVGFVFGLLGTVQDLEHRIDQVAAARLQMYSAIMGVLPEYQNLGLGYRLKLAQREFAIRIGVRLITWTFDPLESLNGFFNVVKLGVVCHRYLRDFHGPMGGINEGLETDRFHVDWWVTSNRVQVRLSGQRGALGLPALQQGGAVLVNEITRNAAGLPVPPDRFLKSEHRILLIEIPDNFQLMKRQDMALALNWRSHGRALFEHFFQNHYLVTDFVRHQEPGGTFCSYYVLSHADS